MNERLFFRGDFNRRISTLTVNHGSYQHVVFTFLCISDVIIIVVVFLFLFFRLASCVKNNLQVKKKKKEKSISDFPRSLANVACPGLLVAAWHLSVYVSVCEYE